MQINVETHFQRCFWLNHADLRLSVEMLKAFYISNLLGVFYPLYINTLNIHIQHT
jgi:hypothetical protein